MAWVYILRGSNGRHYIGSCVDLDARFAQHLRGHTATTKRLGPKLAIVAKKQVAALDEGAANRASTETEEESRPRHLPFAAVEQPRKLSGLVGSSNLPPGTPLLLGFRKIWRDILVAAAEGCHEAHAAVFGHRTGPAFLVNITPARKLQHCSALAVSLGRKEK